MRVLSVLFLTSVISLALFFHIIVKSLMYRRYFQRWRNQQIPWHDLGTYLPFPFFSVLPCGRPQRQSSAGYLYLFVYLFINYQQVWSSGQDYVIRLYLKISEKFENGSPGWILASFLDTYSLSTSYQGFTGLSIVLSFRVHWSISGSSSYVPIIPQGRQSRRLSFWWELCYVVTFSVVSSFSWGTLFKNFSFSSNCLMVSVSNTSKYLWVSFSPSILIFS